jgi:nucleoside-diphosphate-sugar epimerase
MKVAITGATGFIGKLLVDRHIQLGDEVSVLSRNQVKHRIFNNNVKFFKGDLLDKESLSKFVENVDILYHCAAEIKDESKMSLSNVEGTKNLIQVASNKIKHWVQLSSTGVYGTIHYGIVNENQIYNPNNEYEKTKLESDFLVLDAAKNNTFTCTLIRPSNVFGQQMSNTSLFQLIKAIDKGVYFFIGPKGASANYVPVENVVEALYLAATNPKAQNQTYIISSRCTIEYFISSIAQKLDKAPPSFRVSKAFIKFIAKLTSFIPRNPLTLSRVDALSNRSIYEIGKIESELGYKSLVSIEEAIEKLVLFYKKNY